MQPYMQSTTVAVVMRFSLLQNGRTPLLLQNRSVYIFRLLTCVTKNKLIAHVALGNGKERSLHYFRVCVVISCIGGEHTLPQ